MTYERQEAQPETLKKSMTPRKKAWSDTCGVMAATACCALNPACGPCRTELPLLSAYATQHAAEGLTVLGLTLP
jgi:hypothetical protein